MTYYEELGVSPTATTEEIKRAYRQISKLFHPDTQTDENVRQIAEIQQKRLNAIVATLTNPEERRLYDQSLRPAEFAPVPTAPPPGMMEPFVPPPAPSNFRAGRRQSYVWVGLFALPIVGSALFWWTTERNIVGVPIASTERSVEAPPVNEPEPLAATGAASSPPTVPSSTAGNSANNSPQANNRDFLLPPPAPLMPAGTRSGAVVPVNTGASTARASSSTTAAPSSTMQATGTSPAHTATAAQPNTPPAVGTAPAIAAVLPPNSPRVNLPPSAAPPPPEHAPPVESPRVETVAAVTSPALNVPPPSPANPGLNGLWIYVPVTNGKSNNRAIYPPEFVELSLQDNRGHLQGTYRSRYRINDRPVPPEMNFQFQGADRVPQQFNWKLSDGTRGQVRLQQLTATTLQVDWFVTQFGRSPGLASGSAVLTKRP